MSLEDLGWSDFFQDQLVQSDLTSSDGRAQILPVPMRISRVQRVRFRAISGVGNSGGEQVLYPPKEQNTGDFAVGDWVLADADTGQVVRLLKRKSVLQRLMAGPNRSEGERSCQLIAANVDTLFIVTSCNADFKLSWLDLFLALAFEAGVHPVIVITKADTVESTRKWEEQARSLSPDLTVVVLDARNGDDLRQLDQWCGPGQSVALVGSSGVGKSTLLNGLAGLDQATGSIREKDDRGRHTTTARSLHRVRAGGWVIDTPGIQRLRLQDVMTGIGRLFGDITEASKHCHFRDCKHEKEPGCALLEGVSKGAISASRLERWHNLRLTDDTQSEADRDTAVGWREQLKAEEKTKRKNKFRKR
ncbi:ribosome small subunit-dependent GTPase A [Kiloniella laminariae]|uniref:Small ribosomal subunit biogenesis GTPase RsgA n=1 Tax=Kiloniella laminariae TaxID=454162 RepID=A0ABT4LN43_9PROT|nr:ribosome small subunit-dependent GTPase A [Kiloniella laminariae]MCZ4282529.1 ribosome small subunit-dependent GTPase A [Kiloniella laminariae]